MARGAAQGPPGAKSTFRGGLEAIEGAFRDLPEALTYPWGGLEVGAKAPEGWSERHEPRSQEFPGSHAVKGGKNRCSKRTNRVDQDQEGPP